MVQRLGDASIDVECGWELLRGLHGDIRLAPRGDHLVAQMGLGIAQPILALIVVAGALAFSAELWRFLTSSPDDWFT